MFSIGKLEEMLTVIYLCYTGITAWVFSAYLLVELLVCVCWLHSEPKTFLDC